MRRYSLQDAVEASKQLTCGVEHHQLLTVNDPWQAARAFASTCGRFTTTILFSHCKWVTGTARSEFRLSAIFKKFPFIQLKLRKVEIQNSGPSRGVQQNSLSIRISIVSNFQIILFNWSYEWVDTYGACSINTDTYPLRANLGRHDHITRCHRCHTPSAKVMSWRIHQNSVICVANTGNTNSHYRQEHPDTLTAHGARLFDLAEAAQNKISNRGFSQNRPPRNYPLEVCGLSRQEVRHPDLTACAHLISKHGELQPFHFAILSTQLPPFQDRQWHCQHFYVFHVFNAKFVMDQNLNSCWAKSVTHRWVADLLKAYLGSLHLTVPCVLLAKSVTHISWW